MRVHINPFIENLIAVRDCGLDNNVSHVEKYFLKVNKSFSSIFSDRCCSIDVDRLIDY